MPFLSDILHHVTQFIDTGCVLSMTCVCKHWYDCLHDNPPRVITFPANHTLRRDVILTLCDRWKIAIESLSLFGLKLGQPSQPSWLPTLFRGSEEDPRQLDLPNLTHLDISCISNVICNSENFVHDIVMRFPNLESIDITQTVYFPEEFVLRNREEEEGQPARKKKHWRTIGGWAQGVEKEEGSADDTAIVDHEEDKVRVLNYSCVCSKYESVSESAYEDALRVALQQRRGLMWLPPSPDGWTLAHTAFASKNPNIIKCFLYHMKECGHTLLDFAKYNNTSDSGDAAGITFLAHLVRCRALSYVDELLKADASLLTYPSARQFLAFLSTLMSYDVDFEFMSKSILPLVTKELALPVARELIRMMFQPHIKCGATVTVFKHIVAVLPRDPSDSRYSYVNTITLEEDNNSDAFAWILCSDDSWIDIAIQECLIAPSLRTIHSCLSSSAARNVNYKGMLKLLGWVLLENKLLDSASKDTDTVAALYELNRACGLSKIQIGLSSRSKQLQLQEIMKFLDTCVMPHLPPYDTYKKYARKRSVNKGDVEMEASRIAMIPDVQKRGIELKRTNETVLSTFIKKLLQTKQPQQIDEFNRLVTMYPEMIHNKISIDSSSLLCYSAKHSELFKTCQVLVESALKHKEQYLSLTHHGYDEVCLFEYLDVVAGLYTTLIGVDGWVPIPWNRIVSECPKCNPQWRDKYDKLFCS
eukprot:PhF_6_TR21955/c0_g1_i1/m.31217